MNEKKINFQLKCDKEVAMSIIENSKDEVWQKIHGVLGAKSGLEIASDIDFTLVCKNNTGN